MALSEFGNIQASQSVQMVQSILLTGNTAGGTSITGGDIYLSAAGNLTASITGSTIVLSANAGGAGDGGNILIAGTQTAGSTNSVLFSNQNGITFGMSNSSVITASHNGITQQSTQPAVGLNTAQTNVTWTVNSSGISINAAGYAGTGTSATNASVTLNSNGLAVSVAAPVTTNGLLSAIKVSAGTLSSNRSDVTFSNLNGVTFGLETNGIVTASVQTNYLTTARASNDGVGLNTAQTNVTWTVNSSGISINAAGYAGTGTSATNASVTLNSNGLAISVAAGGGLTQLTAYATSNTTNSSSGTIALSNLIFKGQGAVSVGVSNGSVVIDAPNAAAGNVTFSAGSTNAALANVSFANSNNLSFGLSGSTITASFNAINVGVSTFGNTAGTTGTVAGAGGQIVFVGEDGIRMSQSINGNSITLTVDKQPIKTHIPYYPASTGVQTLGAQGVTSASAWYFPVLLLEPIEFNQLEQLMTASVVSSSVAFSHTVTHQFGLFSNNAGTLSLISSSSYSVGLTGSSVSFTINCPASYRTAGGYTYSNFNATTTAQAQSLFGTAGNRIMSFGFGNTMSMSEGIYWVGIHQRQSSSSANGGMAFALGGNVMAAPVSAGGLGSSTAAYTGTANTLVKIPWGVATSTGSAAYGGSQLPSAVNITAMGMTATVMPMMTFISR